MAGAVAVLAACARAPAPDRGETPATTATGSTDVGTDPSGPAIVVDAPDESHPPDCRKLGESPPASVDGLQATVGLFDCGGQDARELLLNARVWNVSDHPIRFFRMPTWYPMLVFEVRRAAGEAIPNGPPPVPPEPSDGWWLELAPDHDYLFDASVGSVMAVDLEPGDYELRFTYENGDDSGGTWVGKLETGWVRFTQR
ncbi:MAG: hypothetical protein HY905_21515 [Deltaproteobacteria bacterium]|nr:hypothetical protein [Deltaproteobacteria bacterium]